MAKFGSYLGNSQEKRWKFARHVFQIYYFLSNLSKIIVEGFHSDEGLVYYVNT